MGLLCSPLLKLLIFFLASLLLVFVLVSILTSSPSIPNPDRQTASSYKDSSSRISIKDLRSNINEDFAREVVGETKSSVLSALPLTVEAASPDFSPAKYEAALLTNISRNSTHILVSAINELHDTPPTVQQRSDLDRLEAGLRSSRAAIKEARYGNQTYDPEFTPVGPMYWNANAFHRSYLEMEKRLKVYVYEEGEPPLFHNGPCKSIYSTEGNFIHQMEIDSKFRTKNPNRAHVFFIPFSVAKLVQFVYVRDSHDFSTIRHTVTDYINIISSRYPYWNRSLAADHFMLSCHDWGPVASFSVPYLGKNAIRVLCNANTSEGFKPKKDVSLPEINLQTGHIKGFIGGPSPSRRPILAFFAGGLHGPIRPVLFQHWENKDDQDMKIYKYLPKGVSYYAMLRNSKFCICPSGYEVASPRIVEAIYTGCVPVLISDHYVPPFSDVLNWKSFSVSVEVKEIPNLKNILLRISTRQYLRMYRRVLQVRRHFEVNSPPKRFDFFHMILHSVWLRRLNVRVGEYPIVANES